MSNLILGRMVDEYVRISTFDTAHLKGLHNVRSLGVFFVLGVPIGV